MQSNLREYDLGQVNEMYKIKINTRASIQWPLLKVIEWVIVDNHQEKIIVSIVGDTNEIKEWMHANQEKYLMNNCHLIQNCRVRLLKRLIFSTRTLI